MADDPSIPTQFGWDASHYDGILHAGNLEDAKAEGIVFFTHKVGEGRTGDDELDANNLAAARDAGIEFIGGYYVVRSGDVTVQVDNCLALADRDVPWWRDFPGWFWQVDLEKWSYDSVPAATGIAFAKQLRARTGHQVILYASRGQYGDSLTDWDGPLWNASYGSNPEGPFRDIYPGDSSSRWAPYSGQTPAILQYGSRAIIAGLSTCDANAFRGTYEDLRALITGGDDMAGWDLGGAPVPAGYESKTPHQCLIDLHAQFYKEGSAWDGYVFPLTKRIVETDEKVGGISVPAPAPVDLDALVAKLGPVIEVAAERAVRKVLGAVDGATPAGTGS